MDVIINGIRYVPAEEKPDGIKFYYMHDNHTFSRLHGVTLEEVLAAADVMAQESHCGMLCPPILFADGKEVRSLKEAAHAPCCGKGESKWIEGKTAWREECEADSDVMRLVTYGMLMAGARIG